MLIDFIKKSRTVKISASGLPLEKQAFLNFIKVFFLFI